MFPKAVSLDNALTIYPFLNAGEGNLDERRLAHLSEVTFCIYYGHCVNGLDNNLFISKQSLEGNLGLLAEKVSAYIANRLQELKLEQFILKDTFPILQKDIASLENFAKLINVEKLSPQKKDQAIQVDEHLLSVDGSPQSYEAAFKKHPKHSGPLREAALKDLNELRDAAWTHKDGVKVVPDKKELPHKRDAFFDFYKYINDLEVQEVALSYLTELLDNDLLIRETTKGLHELLEKLAAETVAAKAQKIDPKLQYCLTNAYGLAHRCRTLQYFKGNLGSMIPESQIQMREAAEEIASLNKHGHPGINFWSWYALEAALRIETNETFVEKRIKDLGRAFRIASCLFAAKDLAATIGLACAGDLPVLLKLPDDLFKITESAGSIVEDLFSIYNDLSSPDALWERILTLEKMCLYALNDIDSFKKVADEFKRYKSNTKVEPKMIYAIVGMLKSVALNSHVTDIQEVALTQVHH